MSSSNASKGLTITRLFYLVILLALVFGFYKELIITSIRFYTSVVKDPQAEQVLGNYYRSNARMSQQLSYSFYASALEHYQTILPRVTQGRKAEINLRIGQLYECGKGTVQNLATAKYWYTAALAASDKAVAEHKSVDPHIAGSSMNALSRIEEAMKDQKSVICPPETDLLTIQN